MAFSMRRQVVELAVKAGSIRHDLCNLIWAELIKPGACGIIGHAAHHIYILLVYFLEEMIELQGWVRTCDVIDLKLDAVSP